VGSPGDSVDGEKIGAAARVYGIEFVRAASVGAGSVAPVATFDLLEIRSASSIEKGLHGRAAVRVQPP
jgi:hypothetical protein